MTPFPLPFFIAENKLTTDELLKTLAFQDVLIGGGILFGFLFIVPWYTKYQGMHGISDEHTFLAWLEFHAEPNKALFRYLTTIQEERAAILRNPILRRVFGKARRWYDHIWLSLFSTTVRTTAAFLVGLTLFIVVTDIGWATAWSQYISPAIILSPSSQDGLPASDPNYLMFLLMARASGQPNGAHLLSYITVAALAFFVSYRFRDKAYSISADFFQGILVAGFGVAFHEGPWLIAYWIRYYAELGLTVGANFVEDAGFGLMLVMLCIGFWKYPFRTIPMKVFLWPAIAYATFIAIWLEIGLPITTVNNWQIGQGIYGVTQWFANPFVNGIEIAGWLLVCVSFFLVIRRCKPENTSPVI